MGPRVGAHRATPSGATTCHVALLAAQDRFVAELDECCWLDIVLHPLATSDVRPRVCCLPYVASAVHPQGGGGGSPRKSAANDDHCRASHGAKRSAGVD